VTLKRFAARTDANHKPITNALLKAGVRVYAIGWPCDLLCIHRDTAVPVFLEIKSSDRAKLTDAQLDLQARIAGGFFYRVETVEQALEAVGAM
jgi:hypothetical protein